LKAQDSAALNGVVTDATGAVLPSVVVTLSNKSVGTKYVQKTDSHGEYRFLSVPAAPGYVLVFTRTGFSTLNITDVPLTVGNTRTQNVKLTAGSSEKVEVSAANSGATINTTDASIGNNIDVKTLNDLPIQSRIGGISSLFYLQAGVDSNQGAVAGARIDQSSVTIDGMDANDIAAGTTFAIVANAPVDAVEEFKGTIAGLTPALGTGSGGQFQLVTKSGKNRFYGNVNEYHRDTVTSANQYFNNLNGLPRTPLIQNQFGGNIGGPIRIPHLYDGRDKLFFFFNFVDSRIIQSSQGSATVPLPNLYNGQLNYINSGANCGDASRLSLNPECISTLDAAQVSALDPTGAGFNPSVISFLKGRYPLPNDLTLGDGVNTGGYRFNIATPVFNTNYIARIDYNLNEKMKVFGRFTINRENAIESLPVFPTDPVTHPFIDRSYSYVVSHVWQIGSNKVNQFYYGDTISKYDFPNAYNPTGADQYSFSGLSGPYSGNDGQKRRVPIPEIRDDFNWQVKSHTITFGGTFKFIKTNSDLTNNFNFVGIGLGGGTSNGLDNSVRPCADPNNCGNALTDINQTGTGVALNDYDQIFTTSLGTIGSISSNYDYTSTGAATPQGSGGPRAYRYFQTELYVGDTWKINSKLTLSYGLRYQLYSVPYEAHGSESVETYGNNSVQDSTYDGYIKARLAQSSAASTDPAGLPLYSVILGGKANKGPNLYSPSYKDFAPRVALAFNPSPKTVFNIGAGIVYDRTVINAINFLQDQISYLFSNTQTNNFGASTPGASLAAQPRVQTGNFTSLSGQSTPGFTYDHSNVPPPAALTVPYTPYVAGSTLYGLGAGETNFVISPNLKDPYSIALNAGVQQEFPGHLVLKVNYVSRLGRRLLADADAGQVLDFPDTTSGQLLSQAFANLTTQLRAGANYGNVTPIPWFEHVLAPGTGAAFGFPSNTSLATRLAGTYAKRGDISDSLYLLGYYTAFGGVNGFLPPNVGIPSQFGSNTYLTNQGNSNYNALLVTVDKNLSSGLKAEFNYTWEHSIDNTSLSANGNALFINAGFICDITKPRACRGSSDFDVRQEISSYFIYHLPIGRGKTYAANSSRLLDEAIGGWTISGIPFYRTGVAITPYSDAYLASFDNDDPAIFTGNKGDLKVKVNQSNGTVYAFAGGAAGAAKVASEFRGPIGLEYGQRNLVNGPGAFTLDAGLEKLFPILDDDKLNLTFRADGFNVLNHTTFGTPGLNIVTQASPFGQITGAGRARVGQFSLRLEF
jgi:hypothetical protein